MRYRLVILLTLILCVAIAPTHGQQQNVVTDVRNSNSRTSQSATTNAKKTAENYPTLFKQGNKYGYKDAYGKVVIKPQYSMAHPFSDGLARVRSGKGYIFIDTQGKKKLSATRYQEVGDFNDGYALVGFLIEGNKEMSYTYIDKKGKRTIKDMTFKKLGDIEGGLALIKSGEYSYYADIEGKQISPMFLKIEDEREGIRKFETNNGFGFINAKTAKSLTNETFANALNFWKGMAAVKSKKNGYWGFINTDGQLIIPHRFEGIEENWVNDRAIVQENGKRFVIDKSGNRVSPIYYAKVGTRKVGDAIAINEVGEKLGLKYKDQIILPAQYSNIELLTNLQDRIELITTNENKKGLLRFYFQSQSLRWFFLTEFDKIRLYNQEFLVYTAQQNGTDYYWDVNGKLLDNPAAYVSNKINLQIDQYFIAKNYEAIRKRLKSAVKLDPDRVIIGNVLQHFFDHYSVTPQLNSFFVTNRHEFFAHIPNSPINYTQKNLSYWKQAFNQEAVRMEKERLAYEEQQSRQKEYARQQQLNEQAAKQAATQGRNTYTPSTSPIPKKEPFNPQKGYRTIKQQNAAYEKWQKTNR